MPSARWAISWRRPATARHSPAAQAALSTRRDSARGCSSGRQPPGAAVLGAHASKSRPRPT
eukprot:10898329-Lingulodinium_polyedra.AAC.1